MDKPKKNFNPIKRISLISKVILGLLLALSIIFNLISLFMAPLDSRNEWLGVFFQNIGTDFFGALITYLLLENIIGGWKENLQEEKIKAERAEEQKRKIFEQQIISVLQLKSSSTPSESQNIIDKMVSLNLFKGITVSDINLNNLRFSMANFAESKIESSTFIYSILEKCTFDFSSLSKVNFTSATIKNVSFNNVVMIDIEFTNSVLNQVRIVNGNVRNNSFTNSQINNSIFEISDISYSDFSDANLEGTSFIQANLTGVDFRGARLYGVSFADSDLSGVLLDLRTTLPDGKPWRSGIDLSQYTK